MSRHFVILGAGISGLATAWFLKQEFSSNDRLTVIDQADRPGGWIQTIHQQGFLFEQGPRSCRMKGGQETLALAESIGLANEVIAPHQDAQKRYIFHKKNLYPLPNNLWEVPFNSLTSDWYKALWADWKNSKRIKEDESIRDFFIRRLGPAWTERLVDPFILGIYAGNTARLSLKSCFPLFNDWEQQFGSLLKGMLSTPKENVHSSAFVQSYQNTPLFSFKKGMEMLPKTLASHLNESIRLKTEAKEFKIRENGIQLILSDGSSLHADFLISTLPTFSLSGLFPQFKEKLSHVSYATVIVLNLGFNSNNILKFKGFGYLVPSGERSSILGCVWDSCIFPQHNSHPEQTRLTVMLGGTGNPAVSNLNDKQLIKLALKELRDQCGLTQSPDVIQIKRAYQAIPQFEIGYENWKNQFVTEITSLSPHIRISGSAFTGVSINDCIKNARLLSKEILKTK